MGQNIDYSHKITSKDKERAAKLKAALVKKLTEIRKEKGYRVRLAESLDIKPSTIQRMEENKIAINLEKYFLWCMALKVDPMVVFIQALSKE